MSKRIHIHCFVIRLNSESEQATGPNMRRPKNKKNKNLFIQSGNKVGQILNWWWGGGGGAKLNR
jgi:hypothetical protein